MVDRSHQFPEPVAVDPPPALMVPTVLAVTGLGMRSDVAPEHVAKYVRANRGMVHAWGRPDGSAGPDKTRHAFVWVDLNTSSSLRLDAAVSQLVSRGYPRASIEFVPYSSKAVWLARHPSSVDATTGERGMQSVMDRESYGRARRLFQDSVLTDEERDELHLELYLYCGWLRERLGEVDALREAAIGGEEEGRAEDGLMGRGGGRRRRRGSNGESRQHAGCRGGRGGADGRQGLHGQVAREGHVQALRGLPERQ